MPRGIRGSSELSETLGIRLSTSLKARLQAASTLGPYKLNMTQVAERGIVLAIEELERLGREDTDPVAVALDRLVVGIAPEYLHPEGDA